MADIALGSVERIVQIGLAIKEAADTVQQNKEECLEIKKRVVRITAILKQLEEKKMMDDPMMKDLLQDLEETLRRTCPHARQGLPGEAYRVPLLYGRGPVQAAAPGTEGHCRQDDAGSVRCRSHSHC